MTNLRIMVWNVENFGNNVPAKGDYQPLCDFIAWLVAQQEVDILVIQEVRSGGAAALTKLAQALDVATQGGDWFHDHVLGALVQDPRTTLPTSPAHTKSSADHHEGYALFWNNARHDDFTLVTPAENISRGTAPGGNLPGTVPANALTLVYQGRDSSGGLGQIGWFSAPNFDKNKKNAESFLDFCRSAWTVHRGDQSAADSRRPCSFTINLDPGNHQNSPQIYLVPVTVFHNISNDANTSFNVQLSGYSRQLYQVYDPSINDWRNAESAIIAGDFNLDTLGDDDDRKAYYTYTNSYDYFFEYDQGGAAASPALFDLPNFDNSPATIVELRKFIIGPLIEGDQPAAFLRRSIDHIFYSLPEFQPANPPGWVVPLFDMVMRSQAYDGLPDIIKNFMTPIDAALGARVGDKYANYPYREKGSNTPAIESDGKKPIISSLLDWDRFRLGILQSRFRKVNGVDQRDDARAAAEFIRQLISDHLPTVISFDY